jgi:hypothetical protein
MVRAKGMAEHHPGRMEQAVEWLHKVEVLLKGNKAGMRK